MSDTEAEAAEKKAAARKSLESGAVAALQQLEAQQAEWRRKQAAPEEAEPAPTEPAGDALLTDHQRMVLGVRRRAAEAQQRNEERSRRTAEILAKSRGPDIPWGRPGRVLAAEPDSAPAPLTDAADADDKRPPAE